MKYTTKFFGLLSLLIILTTGNSFANSCEGVSIANAVGLETGSRNMSAVDPYNAPSSLYIPYAGTFTGVVDGNYTEFYCVDIRNWLGFNEDYSDSAYVKPKINYILQNYYPNKTGYAGQLPLDSSEAAAVQIAIWYFSDNLNAATLQNNNLVRDRAIEIISDADFNGATFVPIHTVQIITVSILGDPDIADTLKVKVTDENGNPISGKLVNLSINSGSYERRTANARPAHGRPGAGRSRSGSQARGSAWPGSAPPPAGIACHPRARALGRNLGRNHRPRDRTRPGESRAHRAAGPEPPTARDASGSGPAT